MMSIRDTSLQGPRCPDDGIMNDQQGLCAQAKRRLSSSTPRNMFQSGNYQARGSFPYRLNCAGIP